MDETKCAVSVDKPHAYLLDSGTTPDPLFAIWRAGITAYLSNKSTDILTRRLCGLSTEEDQATIEEFDGSSGALAFFLPGRVGRILRDEAGRMCASDCPVGATYLPEDQTGHHSQRHRASSHHAPAAKLKGSSFHARDRQQDVRRGEPHLAGAGRGPVDTGNLTRATA
jgi:hypothetical protein